MKRLLILNQNYFKFDIGGSEHQSYLLAKEFIKFSYEVHYLFIDTGIQNIPTMDKGIYLHPIKQIYKSKYFGKPIFLYKNIILGAKHWKTLTNLIILT